MAKKKSDKETEPKKVSTKRFSAFFKNETTHFVIGLISVIFAVYLLLAFTSFFFTGAADQSILDNQQPGELMQTTNHVKNYAGARGAQLAEFLINECFGLAAYFIILFLAVKRGQHSQFVNPDIFIFINDMTRRGLDHNHIIDIFVKIGAEFLVGDTGGE